MSNNVVIEEKEVVVNGGEVLLFTIDEVVYGIEIDYIDEIIGIEQITVVPKVPDYIKGVINIRGKIVPIISIRKRFGKEEIPYDERTCIIVIELESGHQVGVIVDRVREVTQVKADEICSTPAHKNVNVNNYIKSIIENADGIKLLLNCERLVTEQFA